MSNGSDASHPGRLVRAVVTVPKLLPLCSLKRLIPSTVTPGIVVIPEMSSVDTNTSAATNKSLVPATVLKVTTRCIAMVAVSIVPLLVSRSITTLPEKSSSESATVPVPSVPDSSKPSGGSGSITPPPGYTVGRWCCTSLKSVLVVPIGCSVSQMLSIPSHLSSIFVPWFDTKNKFKKVLILSLALLRYYIP